MKLSLNNWLKAQCHREDAGGELARYWLSESVGGKIVDVESWMGALGKDPKWSEAARQAKEEYAIAVDCLRRGKSAPTFPRLFASEDYQRKLHESSRKHKVQPEVSSDAYLSRKHLGLQKALEGCALIYLDTNHWINLRHVFIGSRHALREYAKVLAVLDQLAEKGRVICPISFPLFLELMKQCDMETRKATAEVDASIQRRRLHPSSRAAGEIGTAAAANESIVGR